MTIKYHISSRTGEPMKCTATQGGCPFGDHYTSKDDARYAFESKMSEKLFPSFSGGEINVSPLSSDIKTSSNSFVVPQGVYLVGDPQMTAGRNSLAWDRWRVAANSDDDAVGAAYNGHPVLGLRTSTAGIYHDNMGRSLDSQSGYLGLTPMSLVKQMGISDDDVEDSGYIISFNEPTKVESKDGVLHFGDKLSIEVEPNFDDNFPLEDGDDWFSTSAEDYFYYNYNEEDDESSEDVRTDNSVDQEFFFDGFEDYEEDNDLNCFPEF